MYYILSLIVFILLINTGQSQIIFLDDVTTVAGGGDTLGVDLLLNGNAELAFADTNEWVAKFGSTVTQSSGEHVHGGTYSVKTVTAGGGTGVGPVTSSATVTDSTYWLEGWCYVVDGAANVLIEYAGEEYLVEAKDAWTYFKLSFTETASGYKTFKATEYGAGGNTTFYLDDCSIKRRLP